MAPYLALPWPITARLLFNNLSFSAILFTSLLAGVATHMGREIATPVKWKLDMSAPRLTHPF